jgi:hypothetical protein
MKENMPGWMKASTPLSMDTKVFNQGEFDEKEDVQRRGRSYLNPRTEALMTVPDVLQPGNLGTAAYSKPALALHLLRKYILGEKRFDYAFRSYIKRWAFKHPTPWDFFHTMENVGGEDLGWFWRGWILNNWNLDQGIKDVKYVNNDPAKGALITLENLEEMAMPVVLAIQQENGRSDTVTLPAEIWQKGSEWTFNFPSVTKIKSVIIDPSHDFPDIDPSNNNWNGTAPVKPVPPGVSPSAVIDNYLKSIGGKEKLAAVKDLSFSSTGSVQGQKITYTRKYKTPDKYLMEIDLPELNMTAVKLLVNGDSIHITQMGQTAQSVDEDTRKKLKQETIIFPELNFSGDAYKPTLTSIKNIDGKDAYELKITNPSGQSVTYYYDVSTGYKLRTIEPNSQQGATVTDYGDYRDVNGIKFPFHINIDQGEIAFDLTVQNIKVNSGLTEADFK